MEEGNVKHVYLKLATRSLVIAASIDTAVKPVIDSLFKGFKADVKAGLFFHGFVLLLYVLALYLIYKLVSGLLLAAFNNVVAFRQMLEKDFDVEGAYIERVYINGDLEVVGRCEIAFSDGELKLESHAYWPQLDANGSLKLSRVAQVTSLSELCSVKELVMQYVFQDNYLEASKKNKTGLTKLTFRREQHPGFWRKLLWRRGRLVEYSGRFDSFENDIEGNIVGNRLSPSESKKSTGEHGRLEILLKDVQDQITLGKKLRTVPPGD
jgi:hypothetical protein